MAIPPNNTFIIQLPACLRIKLSIKSLSPLRLLHWREVCFGSPCKNDYSTMQILTLTTLIRHHPPEAPQLNSDNQRNRLNLTIHLGSDSCRAEGAQVFIFVAFRQHQQQTLANRNSPFTALTVQLGRIEFLVRICAVRSSRIFSGCKSKIFRIHFHISYRKRATPSQKLSPCPHSPQKAIDDIVSL
jgi:hypothetical protein